MVDDQWVKAELELIEPTKKITPYFVFQKGKVDGIWVEKITYEDPNETRLPTRAELLELLKKHPHLRVMKIGDDTERLWPLEGDVLFALYEFEFTLDLGETFHSFERDWSEEL